jgi:hypothetical protein
MRYRPERNAFVSVDEAAHSRSRFLWEQAHLHIDPHNISNLYKFKSKNFASEAQLTGCEYPVEVTKVANYYLNMIFLTSAVLVPYSTKSLFVFLKAM